jgi:hypothetical protein
VTATDSAVPTAAQSTKSVTVTVSTGGGGSGAPANCTSQGFNVIGGPVIVPWGQGFSSLSNASGAFGDNTVWLFQITVPAGALPSTTPGAFTVAESQSLATPRQMTVSATACDFSSSALAKANGNTVSIHFGAGYTGGANLTPGATYYINVRNYSQSLHTNSCGRSSCSAIMSEQPASP